MLDMEIKKDENKRISPKNILFTLIFIFNYTKHVDRSVKTAHLV
mgnify:CR=1 FL=1